MACSEVNFTFYRTSKCTHASGCTSINRDSRSLNRLDGYGMDSSGSSGAIKCGTFLVCLRKRVNRWFHTTSHCAVRPLVKTSGRNMGGAVAMRKTARSRKSPPGVPTFPQWRSTRYDTELPEAACQCDIHVTKIEQFVASYRLLSTWSPTTKYKQWLINHEQRVYAYVSQQ